MCSAQRCGLRRQELSLGARPQVDPLQGRRGPQHGGHLSARAWGTLGGEGRASLRAGQGEQSPASLSCQHGAARGLAARDSLRGHHGPAESVVGLRRAVSEPTCAAWKAPALLPLLKGGAHL